MKPHIVFPEDGSVLIEWIEEGRRFGISLEPNIEESGWYYVSKGEMEFGSLPEKLIDWLWDRA